MIPAFPHGVRFIRLDPMFPKMSLGQAASISIEDLVRNHPGPIYLMSREPHDVALWNMRLRTYGLWSNPKYTWKVWSRFEEFLLYPVERVPETQRPSPDS